MKHVLQILSIATVMVLMGTFQPAIAQSDIDPNRMNRDINIMENVLEELFKTRWSAHGNNVRVHTGSFSFGRSNDINGTYLPDYGVIFTIPGGSPGFVMTSNAEGEDLSFNFEYGDETNGEKVTEESITKKIVEFLRDYGSTIGQLSDDHQVMVIYKANRPHREIAIFRSSGEESKSTQQKIPTISVVANTGDLKAYRSGDLSDEQFRNQLNITSVDASANQEKDLKVMASILETAFEDSDEESFEVRGPVNFLKLDNFGALFSFDARYSNRSGFDLSNLHESLKVVREDLERTRAELQENIDVDIEVRDTVREQKRKEAEANRAEEREKIQKAYEQFLSDLKSTIADYGRTLRSVESNQQILVSVNLHSRHEDIPDRIDLQVRKSALENNSRDQAINQISIREY